MTDLGKWNYPAWVSRLYEYLKVFEENPVVLSPLGDSLIHERETAIHRKTEDEAGAGAYGKAQVNPTSSIP